MSLDIYFFKNGFDIQKSRADMDSTYTKLQAIKTELEANPDKYKAYNPPNGWGSYENFVSFCKSVLQKCSEYPDAVIEARG
ncbi:MAG: hypothetical protein LBG80_13400 [Bacteroidales bacterium]|jgi:hypothetical protein|nr:hypothetical protein [Bacteroidales bacterium]